MTRRRGFRTVVGLCALLAPAHGLAATPAWLQQAALAAPRTASDAHATVLVDESSVTVSPDGKAKTVRHYAVRIHDRAGRDAAMIREVYVTGSGNVRSIRGWLLRGSAEARELGDRNIIDAALAGNDVYNDVRVRVLRVSDEVADGDIFGAELESEERLLFSQFEWSLQDRWPVAVARRTLTLPERWQARAVTFNAAPIAQRGEGRTLTWEVSNLPAIPDEPAMPPLSSLVPRLVVSLFGETGERGSGQFDTWQDVARWLDTVSHDEPASAAITQKARALTASARTELERISAIGQYVQHVQYVSIQTGIGRGGGYQPRGASLVLDRNYGDCKDKANLMRALLGAAGIKAYLVTIYSGDRDYVRAEWPSPQQFNHAIVAIAVGPDTSAPVVFEHPSLGRLFLFDPTAEFTPPGELPLDEQGSLALVVSPSTDALTRVPSLPRESNRLERTLDGAMTTDGGLIGRMQEQSHGARAAEGRAVARLLDPAKYRAVLERRVTAAVPSAVLNNVAADPSTTAASFTVAFDVAAPRYAQRMGSLLLLKLPLGLDDLSFAAPGARQTKIVLEPQFTTESIHIRLPAGMAIDEVPGNVSLDAPFGHYSLTYTTEGDAITARRAFELRAQTLDAAAQAELIAFLARVRAADAAPIVLKN